MSHQIDSGDAVVGASGGAEDDHMDEVATKDMEVAAPDSMKHPTAVGTEMVSEEEALAEFSNTK